MIRQVIETSVDSPKLSLGFSLPLSFALSLHRAREPIAVVGFTLNHPLVSSYDRCVLTDRYVDRLDRDELARLEKEANVNFLSVEFLGNYSMNIDMCVCVCMHVRKRLARV